MAKTVADLAPDLSTHFPRSPRKTLAGYVIAARTLDKCRAEIAGTLGDYHFDCPLDNQFFDFAKVKAASFRDFAATGANDQEMEEWIKTYADPRGTKEIIAWNNKMRYTRPVDMPIELQEFLESYIPRYLPEGKVVNYWFDVYDIEEGRI
ncbi:MAG: DUF5069 domain-containing protein [Verrucomicrobiota bacterium]